ncbi:hypothetical protein [Calothrix sp. NIES-3974]|nr:hypothetical protein [Calothrix sp. NIES-3974]
MHLFDLCDRILMKAKEMPLTVLVDSVSTKKSGFDIVADSLVQKNT